MPLTAARAKKVVVDFPPSLYEETEAAVGELNTTTSGLVRQAVEEYLRARRRQQLERELQAGYIANAEIARHIANVMMGAEAEMA